MSELLSSIAGGGGLPSLAPDLGFVSNSIQGARQVLAIDATGSLTEILSLTGKFELGFIGFTGLVSGDMNKIKLTIDGTDIWDEDPLTSPSGTSFNLMGVINSFREGYSVKSSLSLSIEMATDNSIGLQYSARPVT